MEILDFVNEIKEHAVQELLAVSDGGSKTEQTYSFEAGQAQLITIRGGAIEKAAIAHLSLDGVKPPGAEKSVNGVVYQMEIFPRNPYCPMGHFNTEWMFAEPTLYFMNLDLFPAVAVQEDIEGARAAMDAVAQRHGRNADTCREGLAVQYAMEHWPGTLAAQVGLQMKGLQEGDLDLFTEAYEALFKSYVGILAKRKDQAFDAEQEQQKLVRNGRWLEYIAIKDRAIKMAQAVGVPPEVLIGLSFPPSAAF
ncbi:coproporphyrinogen III oxidase [Thermodesulfobacteriota bacterium]